VNRVLVSTPSGRSTRLAEKLERVLLRTLSMLKRSECEVSLRLSSDREIARLNRRYRGIDRPTDVLSFAQEAGPLLGDIVISLTTARKQAKRNKHSLARECALLAVHGCLHLIGHDHADDGDARTMFSLQERILRRVAADV
jgi:probable rRNA maturation factor